MKKWVKAVLSAAMVGTFALGALAFASCGVSEKTDPASLKSQKVTEETWSKAVEETSTAIKDTTNYSIKVFVDYSTTVDEKTETISMEGVLKVSDTAIYSQIKMSGTGDSDMDEEGYIGFETKDDGFEVFSYQKENEKWTKTSIGVTTTTVKAYLDEEGLDMYFSSIYEGLLTQMGAYADYEYSDEDKGYVASVDANGVSAKVVVKIVGGKLAYVGAESSIKGASEKMGVLFFDIGTTKISLPKV